MPDDFVADIEIVGTQMLVELMVKVGADLPRLLAGALLDEANVVFRESQVQVPYRFGILKGSGRVGLPEIVGDTVSVEISYGGAAIAYAYIQHQYELHHVNGKKWHYLSDPMEERKPFISQNIALRIDLALKEGRQ